MSLPIVIIFERHWDAIPKLLVKELLPDLVDQGYDTLCFEASQDWTPLSIIASFNSALESSMDMHRRAESRLKQLNITKDLIQEDLESLAELMRQHVSSQKYFEVAEHIKSIPALKVLKTILDNADQFSLLLKGVDDIGALEKIHGDASKKSDNVVLHEKLRIDTIFKNLIKFKKIRKGIAFICGVFHVTNLLARFAEKGLQNDLVYYFPHSSELFGKKTDELGYLKTANESALRNHSYQLSEEQIKPVAKMILNEIIPKIGYKKEIIDANSHALFLNRKFHANFQIFLRPGHYIDALVDMDQTPQIETISQTIHTLGIETLTTSLNKRKYLVIRSVNTKAVADKIHTL